jgi:imidazole glycerol-phosphate synthase subunit HisH
VITIVDTGVGNVNSIQNMLSRIGIATSLSHDRNTILKAEKLILPGIGSFDRGMEELQKGDMAGAIRHKVLVEKTPILGICLGMQILGESSEEGRLKGLNIIAGHSKKFSFTQKTKKVPHMGWNYVVPHTSSALFQGVETPARFYFAHSYYFECEQASDAIAMTPYGSPFASVIQREKVWGVQFHPEKSHRFGMQILRNFASC